MTYKKDSSIHTRKSEHLRIALEYDVDSLLTTGLENIHLTHEALPEVNLSEVDTKLHLFDKVLNLPLLISSLTGGNDDSELINRRLAIVAQETGIALSVGSQRIAIEDPSLIKSFQLRSVAPDILLFSNLGAIQLMQGYSIDECKAAVDMLNADALVLHLNPLQEALQDNGDHNFQGLVRRIEQVCKNLSVPVIVKEVGWGISSRTVGLLKDIGVAAIDVAGAGGTSWSQVESHRLKDPLMAQTARNFRNWGINTVDSIRNVTRIAPEMLVFASGGLRNGIDIVKCLCLGAKLGGMANNFLKAATEGEDILLKVIKNLSKEVAICMFATGARSLNDLDQSKIL
jgi:isopentenyl-diphosphate delta-isomerase